MQSGITIRAPAATEIHRALHLLRNVRLHPEARLLVAVKSHPVERFVAAAAWWPEGTNARFQISAQPGVDRREPGGLLLSHMAEVARAGGMQMIEHADLLAQEHEWFGVLLEQGFERTRSEVSFEVPSRDIWDRVTRLHERYRDQIPSTWHTEPIRKYPPETVLDLIAPHRLMPPEEVRSSWRADSPSALDPELSCILFDGSRPFGVLLLRRHGDSLYVHVQVVHEPNPRLRSLADICLIYHDAQRVEREGPIKRVHFRSGETEHRQTANLALRMGGRELSRHHVLGRKLR